MSEVKRSMEDRSDDESSHKMDMDKQITTNLRVDRQKTTPTFVRMYCRVGGHHKIFEFEDNTVPADDELVIYTWKDATLKELTNLIKEVHEDSRRRDARFSFRSIFQTNRVGLWRARDLGIVYNARPTRDDEATLMDKRYQSGDIIDVAIYLGAAGIAPPQMERYDR